MTEYNQCTYTHDLSDEGRDIDIFEHMDRDEWSCQHPADEDAEYCPFHLPVEEKDDQAVVKQFRNVVNSGYDDIKLPPQERLRFIGAEFGDFSLPLFSTLAGSIEFGSAELDLRDTHITGTLRWSKVTVRHNLRFEGAVINESVNFSETAVSGNCSFDHIKAKRVLFNNVNIQGDVGFTKANIEYAADFEEAMIENDLSLKDAEIGGSAEFQDATINKKFDLLGTKINGRKWFLGLNVGRQLRIGVIHSSNGYNKVIFLPHSSIEKLTIPAYYSDQICSLSFASVAYFDIDSGDPAVLDRLNLLKFDFSNFDFENNETIFSEAGWEFHSLDPEVAEIIAEESPTYEDPDRLSSYVTNHKAWMATYRNARVAANDAGANDISSMLFVREKRIRRWGHLGGIIHRDTARQRASSAFDWMSNLTMDVTTGYGERPRNVVVSSLATVGLFTGIYWALDALEADAGVLEYLLFSFQGFIQFILGVSPRGTVPVRFAIAIQGFLGAFLIALFVFTLTRSLNR